MKIILNIKYFIPYIWSYISYRINKDSKYSVNYVNESVCLFNIDSLFYDYKYHIKFNYNQKKIYYICC